MDYERESFERRAPIARSAAALPAATYNLTRILLAHSVRGCVFVPIRSMQYLAVIDAEEIIFVDSQYKRWVAIAWQGFKPQARRSLTDPVEYCALFYDAEGAETQRRLQAALPAALRQLDERTRPAESAVILSLPPRGA
jgi:hypothetical protein